MVRSGLAIHALWRRIPGGRTSPPRHRTPSSPTPGRVTAYVNYLPEVNVFAYNEADVQAILKCIVGEPNQDRRVKALRAILKDVGWIEKDVD